MRAVWMMLGLLAVCTVTPVLAQINKWVDENGRVHYGDRPPANKPSTTVQIQKSPPPTVQNEASSVAPGKPSAEQPKAGAAGDEGGAGAETARTTDCRMQKQPRHQLRQPGSRQADAEGRYAADGRAAAEPAQCAAVRFLRAQSKDARLLRSSALYGERLIECGQLLSNNKPVASSGMDACFEGVWRNAYAQFLDAVGSSHGLCGVTGAGAGQQVGG